MMEILKAALIGVIATTLADLWQQLLKRGAGLPIANWPLIGRWVAGMPRGRFVHRSIAAAAPVAGESVIGWIFHYLVGVAYADLYLAIVRLWPGPGPGLYGALVFGFATLGAPWLVMQPALGYGAMARRLPNWRAMTVVTVSTHLMFGLGLYAGVLAVSLVLAVPKVALDGAGLTASIAAVTEPDYDENGAPRPRRLN